VHANGNLLREQLGSGHQFRRLYPLAATTDPAPAARCPHRRMPRNDVARHRIANRSSIAALVAPPHHKPATQYKLVPAAALSMIGIERMVDECGETGEQPSGDRQTSSARATCANHSILGSHDPPDFDRGWKTAADRHNHATRTRSTMHERRAERGSRSRRADGRDVQPLPISQAMTLI
jgi:hypothetical protein